MLFKIINTVGLVAAVTAGAELATGKGTVRVIRTEVHQEAVWVRDSDGGEHRIAYDDLPPPPYHKCGDCNCGKKKGKGKNGDSPRA